MDQYRKSPRAKFLDYNEGIYFVTICTLNKCHYFGRIIDGHMHLSAIGKFASQELAYPEVHHAHISVPMYVVMPNHIHAIVIVGSRTEHAPRRVPTLTNRLAAPLCEKRIPSLSMYVNSFKGAITRFANKSDIAFGWQPRFHDHAIRSQADLNKISEYIMANPVRWKQDCLYT